MILLVIFQIILMIGYAFPIPGTLYSIAETLDPSDSSYWTSVDPINGTVTVFQDLSKYGASVGGSAYNAKANEWYLVYSENSIVTGCQVVTINLKTRKVSEANGTMPQCTWTIAYDDETDTLYGTVWNTNLMVQQIVKVDINTSSTHIVCELPPAYGNQYGDSKLSSFNSKEQIYEVIIDGKYYIGQYLFKVNVKDGTFKQITINDNDNNYIFPSLTWDKERPNNLIGIAYITQKGWWSVVDIDTTDASVKTIGTHFADASSSFVWEYNSFFYYTDGKGHDYYFLLVSDKTQSSWYVVTFDCKTGSIMYQAELDSGGKIPTYDDIPNHFLWVPSD